MEIKQIISKSPDGNRMEVIAINSIDILRTLHIHKNSEGKWTYCVGYRRDGQPNLKLMDDKPKKGDSHELETNENL